MPSVPWLVGLLVLATLVNILRKRSWTERMQGPASYAAIGAACGVVALALGILLGTPLVEQFTNQAVQWSMYPVVRGSLRSFVAVALVVAVSGLAAEAVLRGFIVELARELTRNSWVAVVVGALVEALIMPGDAATKLGAGVFGIGLGAMYIAGGRSLLAPVCARIAFVVGAVVLEALRVVG